MSQQKKTRQQSLEELINANPEHAFARYGLAMECIKSGDNETAREHFHKLLSFHPNYLAAYLHYGLVLKKLARASEAQEVLKAGIEVARETGNDHARSELEAALNEIANAS